MKKLIFALFIIFLASGCGKERTSGLPKELEKVLADYLNYQAWCNPSDFPQEETVYSYRSYRSPVEKLKYPETFLEVMVNDASWWYRCTYTRQEVYCIEPLGEEPKGLEGTGSGEFTLPTVTKPDVADSIWKDKALEGIGRALDSYCGKAFGEAYHAGEEIEVYLADFCMENGIMPTMYLLCGDRVCELRGFLQHQVEWMMADMAVIFFAKENEDGSFVTLPKEEVDAEKFERVSQIAVLHAGKRKGEEVTSCVADTCGEGI